MDLDRIQIALLVVAGIMLVESTAGILLPALIKRVADVVSTSPEKLSPLVGVPVLLLAVFLWALILAGLPLTHWVLLFVSVAIAAFGAACLRPGALHRLVKTVIVDRSVLFVRLFYIVELTLGALILWAAIFRGGGDS